MGEGNKKRASPIGKWRKENRKVPLPSVNGERESKKTVSHG
jgi:hypothetical protein